MLGKRSQAHLSPEELFDGLAADTVAEVRAHVLHDDKGPVPSHLRSFTPSCPEWMVRAACRVALRRYWTGRTALREAFESGWAP